ncbi:hypothetical protein EDC01DRAFT_629605 [Geopyxis carbonaria]|nr:hypothetical protein EDC01DRAFT_629605 [Geopyxis carbonaria]
MTATTVIQCVPKPHRVEYFGLVLSSLPPVGTVPSPDNPYVAPLPLCIGIDHIPRTQTTSLHLIHATRENAFLQGQNPIFKPLSVTCQFTRHGDIIFRPDLSCKEIKEGLPQMAEKGLIRELSDALGTWVVIIGKQALSKKCGHCQRWEQMCRNEQGKLKYRRWNLCQGCYAVAYCRDECSDKAWEGGHWETCLKANEPIQDAETVGKEDDLLLD